MHLKVIDVGHPRPFKDPNIFEHLRQLPEPFRTSLKISEDHPKLAEDFRTLSEVLRIISEIFEIYLEYLNKRCVVYYYQVIR